MIKDLKLEDVDKNRSQRIQWMKYVARNLYMRYKFKLHNRLTYKQDFFNAIEIETTTFCNRRCPYCPNSLFDRGLKENEKRMETGMYCSIIDQLKSIKFIGRISLHFYGEPTSDERLPEWVRYARSELPKCEIVIASNGDYLTPELFERLRKAGMSRINVTTHLPNKTMTPRIRALKEHLIENPQKDVKVIYNQLNFNDELENRGGILETDGFVPRDSCYAPSETANIDYAGNWILCCNDYHSSIRWGNLKDENIMDIWNKPRFKKLREDEKKGVFNLQICQGCTNKVKLKL